MSVITLSNRECELVLMKENKNFNLAVASEKLGVSRTAVRRAIIRAEWKIKFFDFFPDLSPSSKLAAKSIAWLIIRGIPLDRIVACNNLLELGVLGIKDESLPVAIRNMAIALMEMTPEKRVEAQKFLLF